MSAKELNPRKSTSGKARRAYQSARRCDGIPSGGGITAQSRSVAGTSPGHRPRDRHGRTMVEPPARIPQIKGQLAGLIALVGPVHQQVRSRALWPKTGQQFSSFRRVVGLPRGERDRYGGSSIRGNHMNLGGPTASGLADGLWSVFLRAPVPSGWTLTMVLSIDTASILIRTICHSRGSDVVQGLLGHAPGGTVVFAWRLRFLIPRDDYFNLRPIIRTRLWRLLNRCLRRAAQLR